MSNIRRYIVTIVILIIISCFGVLLYTIFHDDGQVTVPQLVGMSLPEASDALTKLGITAKVEKVDSQEAVNTVLTQSIKPGKKVKPGESMILQISSGGKQTKIPDVRKMKTADAICTLEEAGFSVTKTIKVNDAEHEPDTVLAQNPYGGQSVATETSVELLVCEGNALGEGSVYVPDLRGKKLDEAEKILAESGLAIGEKNIAASVAPEGTVLGTKPGIGAKVDGGSSVSVTVSSGKEAEKKVAETDAGTVNKESTVKVVKAQPKAEPKKTETKAAVKTDSKQAAKAETKTTAKTEEKQTAKAETKTAAKTEEKQATKAEAKVAAKEPETKQPEKTETKTAETKPEEPQKSAKLRYVVPPLVKPMNLKVTLQDSRGTHVLKDVTVKGNEVYMIPIRYSGKANLTILLGGEEVWQESYR